MQNSQLIQALQYLSPNTFRRFGAFVHSPYHNTNEKLQKLYQCIESCFPNLENNDLNKRKVYPLLFPNEKFNADKLRAMMSLLLKLLKDFLVIEQLKNDTQKYREILSDYYWTSGMEKEYSKTQQKMKATLENKQQDTGYFLQKHLLNEKEYDFTVQKKDPQVGNILQNLIQNIDHYYFAKRLKYTCEALNRKNITQEDFDEEQLLQIESYMQQSKSGSVPLIDIYFQILQTLKDESNNANFELLQSLLKKHAPHFPPIENKVMYGYAMNFCIKKINVGESEYLRKLFELYQLLLQHNIIFEGRYISQWDFKNIVTVALRLEELDWTAHFIEKYQLYLNPEVRENAYTYNKANLSYFKKDYAQTMDLLRTVEFTELSYELSSKSLLIKSYYELNEFNALFSLANTFKLFLRRNKKLSDYQKSIYKNLLRYIVKLAKLKSKFQKVPKKIREEIESSTQIADKSWLLSKAEENKGMEMYGQ